MRTNPALPPTYTATRNALRRVAVHVLARGRHAVTGRFGLRATPGGFGTPAFGAHEEVLRVAGDRLVRERRTGVGMRVTSAPLAGASLQELAGHAGVDLGTALSVGHDTPPLGDPDAPLDVDPAAADALAAWLGFGWSALDRVAGLLGPAGDAAAVQLWPEHFDAATDVAAGDSRVNLGVSPGDDAHTEPYLYVGPWGAQRPGDPSYWNAPFGAVLSHTQLRTAADPPTVAAAFLLRGVQLLAADDTGQT